MSDQYRPTVSKARHAIDVALATICITVGAVAVAVIAYKMLGFDLALRLPTGLLALRQAAGLLIVILVIWAASRWYQRRNR